MFRRTPILDLSDEEIAVGFALHDVHDLRVAACVIASDVLAVKMRTSEGALEYVLCERSKLEPMVVAARDLGGLVAKYPPAS